MITREAIEAALKHTDGNIPPDAMHTTFNTTCEHMRTFRALAQERLASMPLPGQRWEVTATMRCYFQHHDVAQDAVRLWREGGFEVGIREVVDGADQ